MYRAGYLILHARVPACSRENPHDGTNVCVQSRIPARDFPIPVHTNQVGYTEMIKSFKVHAPETGRALPHLEPAAFRGEPDQLTSADEVDDDFASVPNQLEPKRREDRVTFSQLKHNPEALQKVRRALVGKRVAADDFGEIIKAAGIILCDADTHLLFRRVADSDGAASHSLTSRLHVRRSLRWEEK